VCSSDLIIIMVACFFDQHSPILGQPASSHTVTRLFSRTIFFVSAKTGDDDARTRIQLGFFKTGWSGLCCFSGCRTLSSAGMFVLTEDMVSRSVTNVLTLSNLPNRGCERHGRRKSTNMHQQLQLWPKSIVHRQCLHPAHSR